MSRADLPYDFEDFGMKAHELQAKYDKEHPVYTRTEYQEEFSGSGAPDYWDWVTECIRADDDSIPGNDAQGNPIDDNELVEMPDMATFIQLLGRWHAHKIAELQHMQQIPEGIEAVLTDTDGQAKTFEIKGELRQGFILGITTALLSMGTLPFVVELENAPTPPEGAADAAG